MIDLIFLMLAFLFAGIILLIGYIENSKPYVPSKGKYVSPYELNKYQNDWYDEIQRRKKDIEINEWAQKTKPVILPSYEKDYWDWLDKHGGWYPIYVLGKWPIKQEKWIYKHPGD